MFKFVFILIFLQILRREVEGNADAKRLYDDLLANYNRLIRPVGNNSDRLTVKLGLKLSQLIDVNLKSQIMTTNVWVEQEWHDYKLMWNPDEYGGVETLHVPSEHIWLPDIVLYNKLRHNDYLNNPVYLYMGTFGCLPSSKSIDKILIADGNYEVTIMTKAILNYTGTVKWKPPAIYKSSCEIDVEFFPFDMQTCTMKFGSWTYDGYTVDLRHINQTQDSNFIEMGIDLQDYYISVEWDIMGVPAKRDEKYYSCCEEPYPDIVFNITLRRKTLFYTVNLIIPCVGISFLSILVFYLPSDSGEKMSLCISILLSLTVFFLLLAEIIPPTSLAVPLLGKYLLFTMTLITFSVIVTICILNVNYRSPATHRMNNWVKTVFIETLPKYLMMRRPSKDDEEEEVDGAGSDGGGSINGGGGNLQICHIHGLNPPQELDIYQNYQNLPSPLFLSEGEGMRHAQFGFAEPRRFPSEIEKSATNVKFVSQHMKNKDRFEKIEDDWKYVAMVLDRLFLWIFALACVVGTGGIIFRAPSLYDTNRPIDILYSKIAKAKMMQMGPEED